MDRIDTTLAEVAKSLKETDKILKENSSRTRSIEHSNGIMAETFFQEATQKGVTVKNVEYYQYSTNETVALEYRERGKIKRRRLAEFDIVMLSKDLKKMLLIEIKYRLDPMDLHFFEKRIPILQQFGSKTLKEVKHIDTAFASMAFKEGVIAQFQNEGHHVLSMNNNEVYVVPPANPTGNKKGCENP